MPSPDSGSGGPADGAGVPGAGSSGAGSSGEGNLRVARALIEAAFSGDIDGALACCAEDLEVRTEGTQVVHGYEGLRQIIEFHTELFTSVDVTMHHALASGDTAAINRTTHLVIDGKEIDLEVGSFFEFRDGLVCRWMDYQDMGIVMRALGH